MSSKNAVSPSVDPVHLSELGKQAACLAETAGLSLTQAVVHTIGREKLGTEHIRRVVEFANHEAFNRKYSAMSGLLKAVHIEDGPADPVQVIQSLHTEDQPKAVTIDALEYSMPPDLVKSSSISSFVSSRTKGGIMQDIFALQSKLSAAHEELVQNVEASKEAMTELLASLAETAKSASINGAAPSEIFEAWAEVDISAARQVFTKISALLRDNTKVASRRINPEANVVTEFRDFVKAAKQCLANTIALREVEVELRKVSNWISEQGGSYARS